MIENKGVNTIRIGSFILTCVLLSVLFSCESSRNGQKSISVEEDDTFYYGYLSTLAKEDGVGLITSTNHPHSGILYHDHDVNDVEALHRKKVEFQVEKHSMGKRHVIWARNIRSYRDATTQYPDPQIAFSRSNHDEIHGWHKSGTIKNIEKASIGEFVIEGTEVEVRRMTIMDEDNEVDFWVPTFIDAVTYGADGPGVFYNYTQDPFSVIIDDEAVELPIAYGLSSCHFHFVPQHDYTLDLCE